MTVQSNVFWASSISAGNNVSWTTLENQWQDNETFCRWVTSQVSTKKNAKKKKCRLQTISLDSNRDRTEPWNRYLEKSFGYFWALDFVGVKGWRQTCIDVWRLWADTHTASLRFRWALTPAPFFWISLKFETSLVKFQRHLFLYRCAPLSALYVYSPRQSSRLCHHVHEWKRDWSGCDRVSDWVHCPVQENVWLDSSRGHLCFSGLHGYHTSRGFHDGLGHCYCHLLLHSVLCSVLVLDFLHPFCKGRCAWNLQKMLLRIDFSWHRIKLDFD